MSALTHLRSTAGDYGATHLNDDGADAVYSVCPLLASGAPSPTYLVRISERRPGAVVAREKEPILLPAFCPERHIAYGGAFCLYWAEVEPLKIDDIETAAEWWGKLIVFLMRQPAARKQRRWPGKADARAHGPDAARFQAQAEGAARDLGERFETALRLERLTTSRRRRHRETHVRLYLGDTRIATVVIEGSRRRPMTLRSKCPCSDGRALPLVSCGSHAAAIVDLALGIDEWKRAELAFFEDARAAGETCCGSIDGCPLASPGNQQLREAA